MRRRLLPSSLLALAIAACAGDPRPVEAPAPIAVPAPAFAPLPSPPALRLPATASPVRYAATLTLTPSAASFEGAVDIDLVLAEPASSLWLHATEITVREARVEVAGRTVAARATPAGDDFLGFSFAETLPAGPARLHVVYRGEISDKDDRGVFKEQEDGATYLFSQFENIEARRAFPCFDEPSFKVPWQLTLRVPEGDVALSNTPAVSETREAGMKVVRFAETRPLPSYLVAFAVGPFELVDAGRVGKNRTPVRIATPRGRAARAAHAVKVTPELFRRLEDYFGIPYPYEKLDLVAIPNLVSFSAMENAGLVTFLEPALLARPEEVTGTFERRFAVTAAHEIAHQWFGDLVTMAWWDDVWLNEAFATWMEGRIVEQYKPEWRWELARSRATTHAMRGDALVNARRIRQAIASNDDIQNAFDEITYSKGAAVIAMFESFAGEARFRRGVARYLTQHAHRNATSKDFLAAIDAEVHAPLGPAVASFLDQPGVPLVRAELDCSAVKTAGEARIHLSQRRYLPAGSAGSGSESWATPVCLRWEDGRSCVLVQGERHTHRIAAKRCPAWVMLNAGDTGYYHGGYGGPLLAQLFEHGWGSLSAIERSSVLRDVEALVTSGDLPIADALARIPDLLKDPPPDGLESAFGLLGLVRESMVPPGEEERFARFVSRTFGARARAMGWTPKPGEDEATRLFRPHFVKVIADRGADAALIAEAARLAGGWLDGSKALPIDAVDPVLSTAAAHGDRRLFERLRAEARTAKDERRLRHLVHAMSAFRDPAIVRDALAVFLDPAIDARVATELLFQDERMHDVAFAFVKQRYDEVVARTPGELRAELPAIATGFCDEARAADLSAFFKDRVARLTGGPRNLAKALERIKLCAAERRAHEASLRAFLGKY